MSTDPTADPRFSVIVPLHRDSPGFRACLSGCLCLDWPDFEVLVVSDREVEVPAPARLVLTGARHDTGPGEKRDLGMAQANGTVFAFIDDDAVPRPDWLRQAARVLADPAVGAVGGPGVTPADSRWRERAGGAFYESWLGSGPYRYRFRPGAARDVDDYPAYNLVIRRAAAEAASGWGTGFYGGEDTVICLAMVNAGWRIVYDPEVVVEHFRRPVLTPHLRQVGNVGRHRGYFVKAYPETSLRPAYFLPALGTATLGVLALASVFNRGARGLLWGSTATYAAAGFALGLVETGDLSLAASLPAVALASHVTYGVQFVRGLLSRGLER
ncbi:MAG: glycosyltransferase [Candidatus Dormibacteria bacterium]